MCIQAQCVHGAVDAASAYCTAVLYPEGCEHEIDEAELARLGVREIVPVGSRVREGDGRVVYDCDALVAMIRKLSSCSSP